MAVSVEWRQRKNRIGAPQSTSSWLTPFDEVSSLGRTSRSVALGEGSTNIRVTCVGSGLRGLKSYDGAASCSCVEQAADLVGWLGGSR